MCMAYADSEGRDAPANPKPHTSHPLPSIRPTYTLQLGPFGTCPAGHTGGPYERWGRGGEDAIDYQPILLRKQAHCPDWNQPTPRHKRRQIIRLHPRRQSAAAGRSAWPVVPARQPQGVVVGSSGGVGAHGPSVRGQLAAGDDDVGEGKGWRGPSIEEGSGGDARIRIPSPLLTSSRARAVMQRNDAREHTGKPRRHHQAHPAPSERISSTASGPESKGQHERRCQPRWSSPPSPQRPTPRDLRGQASGAPTTHALHRPRGRDRSTLTLFRPHVVPRLLTRRGQQDCSGCARS